MNIAVLGTGCMGFPIARRVCQAGHVVDVWNRSREKAERLRPFGAFVHDDPAAAVANAECVIVTLENGAAVEDVLFHRGVAHALKSAALVIDMSSIKPQEARDHAARLADVGASHLDAPVSGGPGAAEAGTLAIMAGGKAGDFGRAQPIFEVLGKATHVGPHGAGQLANLASQLIVGAAIGAVAEALLLCQKSGADIARVMQALGGGLADCTVLQTHGQRMVERSFAPSEHMSAQLKDLRNALATAEEIGFDAPITALFEKLYSEAVEHGLGELDHAGLFVELASRNGMA